MLTQNSAALKLLLTDDLFLIKEKTGPKTGSPSPATDKPAAKDEPLFSGSLMNGCLVILEEKGADLLSPAAEDTLTKAFDARKASFKDCGVINLAQKQISYDQIRQLIKPKTLLVFGCNVPGAENLQLNTPQKKDGIDILYTFTFRDMLADADRKKAFWEAFKQLF